ncbi:hypothetical protein NBO_591g0006 [Nosema bombycis CQ1]|uniref:Elongator complex protein 4 n=1 Tax=Nosema bombycis (strain CQ1 / CVCC 102059) TaxID=578461 RepID=R0M1W0_NOSB1|nr:hypothetical protein NBO_591g0006 [Nosema bombycis CQ1]|eukprot:EOB12014.1 hypothetical protein NBO_591g0006 [Nosema bombycis CQ1]
MRSSFKKSSQNSKNLTGIPLIDQILGDNERGSMILIREDEYSRIHNILLNTFVSEGVVNNEQDILIIGESDINMAIYELNRTDNVESDIKKMFIAWRYSDLKLEQSSYKFSLSSKGSYNCQKALTQSVSEILSKLKGN